MLGIFRDQFALLIIVATFALITLDFGLPFEIGITLLGIGTVVLVLQARIPNRLGPMRLAAGLALFTGFTFISTAVLSSTASSASSKAFLYNLPDKPSILLQAMGTTEPTCTSIKAILDSPTPYAESISRGVELSVLCPSEFEVIEAFSSGWRPIFLEHMPSLLAEFPRALALRFASLTDASVALVVMILFFYLLVTPVLARSRRENEPVKLRLLSGIYLLLNLIGLLFLTWIYDPLFVGTLFSRSIQWVAALACLVALLQAVHLRRPYSGERRRSLSNLDSKRDFFSKLPSVSGSLARNSLGFGWFIWLIGLLLSFWLITFLPIANLVEFSWVFSGFREPWAKFGSSFVISLAMCLTLGLSILLTWFRQHGLLPNNTTILAAGLTVLALLPVRSQDNLLIGQSYLGTPTQEWVREIEHLSATAANGSKWIGFCFFPSQDLGADILAYRWFWTFTPNVPHRVEGMNLNPAYRQIGLESNSCRGQEEQVRWINVCNSDSQAPGSPRAREVCSIVLPPIPRKSVS